MCCLKNYRAQDSVAQGLTDFQTLADGTGIELVLLFHKVSQLITNWGPMFITFYKSVAMVYFNSQQQLSFVYSNFAITTLFFLSRQISLTASSHTISTDCWTEPFSSCFLFVSFLLHIFFTGFQFSIFTSFILHLFLPSSILFLRLFYCIYGSVALKFTSSVKSLVQCAFWTQVALLYFTLQV